MAKKQSIKFEYVPFERLVFLDNNPRTRTPKGLERMAKDIERDATFYENRPTLVNFTEGEMRVYAGDLRAHAANGILGWKEIPCNIEADVPADIQARRAILDNTHFENWDSDLLSSWDFDISDLEEMAVPGWVYGQEKIGADEFGEDFALPSGDKAPFQQMTFTLADEQAEQIKNAISDIKQTEEYKYVETLGNENTNGNALYLIIMQWVAQRK